MSTTYQPDWGLWSTRYPTIAPDLAVFQQLHELIRREEKLAKGLAQHWWTHVLSGMGFPE